MLYWASFLDKINIDLNSLFGFDCTVLAADEVGINLSIEHPYFFWKFVIQEVRLDTDLAI